MKLYSSDISPFAARVRIALYHKGIEFERAEPPVQGLKSSQYLAINPMGKIPVLRLEDGTVIPESETILYYLEDAHPEPRLMPVEARDRCRMRTIIRVMENYVTPPTARLFPHLDPSTSDATIVSGEISRMREGLRYLDHFVADAVYAQGSELTLADCCIFPSLYLCQIVTSQLNIPDIFGDAPRVTGYFHKAMGDPTLARVHEEISAALRAYKH